MKARDITGQTFGRWSAIKLSAPRHDRRMWLCVCACGKRKIIYQTNLTAGYTKSCGCLRKEISTGNKHSKTHGMTNKGMYWSWIGMRRRCYDIKKKEYKHYGGRGIKVCKEWNESFDCFYNDMKRDWYVGATIERKNPNGNYEKQNCTWVDNKRQRYNCTNTVWVLYKNKRACLADACKDAGLNYQTAFSRVKRGKDMFGKRAV